MLKESLGMLEVKGLVAAITVGDTMAKAANVRIRQKTLAKGHGWTTILVTGDVGSVNAALSAGRAVAVEHDWLVSSKVIARPAYTLENALEPAITPAEENPPKDISPKEDVKVDTKSSEVSKSETDNANTETEINVDTKTEISNDTEETAEPTPKVEIAEAPEKENTSTAKKTTRASVSKAKKTKTKK